MKIFTRLRDALLVAILLIFAGWRAEGQSITFSVTSSASSVLVSNAVTFYINITNLLGLPIANLMVTDSLPNSVLITGASASDPNAGFTNSGSVAIFSLATFSTPGQFLNLSLDTVATEAGSITNVVTISASIGLTNITETNVVVDVTNTIIIANLGGTLTGPNQPVFTGDLTSYEISITNSGPDAAPAVILTNTLPAGVILEGVSPASQTYTQVSSNLIFNLGTIASNGFVNLTVSIEPTNSGVWPYFASLGSASFAFASNSLGSNSLTVFPLISGVLTAVTNSAQSLDFQDAMEEQSILLSNVSTNTVTAARVVVSGLPKQLFNAVGTNSGNPYVIYTAPLSTPLAPGQSVNLLLQYTPHGSFPFTNGQLRAYPSPPPDLTPPVVTATSTNINISGIFKLSDGNILIEFPATVGRTYTIVYSDNVKFSNAMIAPPAFNATVNMIPWIDYGPPATVSAPSTTGNRFYRVIQNP